MNALIGVKHLPPVECPIVADDEHLEIARSYAARFPGREVHDFSRLVCLDSPHVLLICSPLRLRRPVLDVLTRNFPGTAGVVTGRSPLAVARFLARQRPAERWARTADGPLLLDELYQETVLATDQDLERDSYPGRIAPELLTSQRPLLALHVHGEGAHANLGSLVLCGQVPERPSDSGGCTPTSCKRSGHADGRFQAFGSLRATNLLFLSCSGLSVSGEHYPSMNSAALSLIDGGHIRSAICNDRTIPLTQDEVRIAFAMAAGHGMLASHDYLNQLSMRRHNGARPWLWLGDPACAGNPVLDSPRVATIPVDGLSERMMSVAGLGESAVSAVVEGVVHEIHSASRPTIHDDTERVVAAENAARDALAQSLFVELVADLLEEQFGAAEELDSLRSSNSTLRRGLRRALESAAAWRSFSAMAAENTGWLAQLQRIHDLCGHVLVRGLLPFLDRGLDEILRELADFDSIETAGECERCRATLTRSTGTARYPGGPAFLSLVCATCGPRRLHVGGTAPRRPDITLHITSDGLQVEHSPSAGVWCGISMRDKARGANVLSAGPTRSIDLVSPLPITEGLSPDLHTARVLRVSSSWFSIDRLRVLSD